MKFNIKNILGITVCLISQAMVAQFYAGTQLGVGNIQSSVKETIAGNRFGGTLKLGYIHSFTNHLGIGTGLEFSQYKQEVSLNSFSGTLTNYEVDLSSSAFVYSVATSNYKEKQTLHAIQIPLFLQYKKNINKGVDFNFRAGAKYFLPVNYKINVTASQVKGTAYYPDVNLNIDNLPEYGFGSQSNYSASGEYNTKGTVMSMFAFYANNLPQTEGRVTPTRAPPAGAAPCGSPRGRSAAARPRSSRPRGRARGGRARRGRPRAS